MIAKFLDEPVKEDMPETTALEFKYGTKVKEDVKRTKVSIYELGGGRINCPLLASCLNEHSIAQTAVCIVLDLSDPRNTVDSLLFWINAIKEASGAALQKLS